MTELMIVRVSDSCIKSAAVIFFSFGEISFTKK